MTLPSCRLCCARAQTLHESMGGALPSHLQLSLQTRDIGRSEGWPQVGIHVSALPPIVDDDKARRCPSRVERCQAFIDAWAARHQVLRVLVQPLSTTNCSGSSSPIAIMPGTPQEEVALLKDGLLPCQWTRSAPPLCRGAGHMRAWTCKMRRTFGGHTRVKRIPGTPAKHINEFRQQLGHARLATACTRRELRHSFCMTSSCMIRAKAGFSGEAHVNKCKHGRYRCNCLTSVQPPRRLRPRERTGPTPLR